MKRLPLIALALLLASPVFAADAPPKPPTVAELQAQVNQYKAALGVAIQQRDAAQKAYMDEIVNEAARAAPAK